MNEFQIDEGLLSSAEELVDLKLCKLLFVNQKEFPWLILVPKRSNVTEIIDLSEADQQILMNEIYFISKIVKDYFTCDKLNVAALGNQVAQLHIHVIARSKNDKAWPNPIWGRENIAYEAEEKQRIVSNLKKLCNNC